MAKQIDYGQDAFKKLLAGSKKLSDAVAVTLGAKGQNVLIEGVYETDPPHITKDGVTVAKSIQLKDPVERISANLIKKVALETNETCGDGTSTSCVLANAILTYGANAIEQGYNPIMLKRGIDIELKRTLEYLEALKTPLNGNMDMAYQVALVSANGDEKVAQLVTDVHREVGVDGNIAIEPDTNSPTISSSRVEGVEFDRGFNNPYYVTHIPTETVEYNDVLILISDYKIMAARELENVLTLAQQIGKPILIISEDIDPQADTQLAVNKLRNNFPVVTVNAPEFGDRRLHALEDLAVLTGGKFISTVTGKTFDDVTQEDFGRASKIIITRDNTSIIGGKGVPAEIDERLESILGQIENAKNEEVRKHLEQRYAKLKGGVVVIKVGAYSDVEREELKDRIEDAVNAVKSALIDGIIPGGGAPLLRISLSPLVDNKKYSNDIMAGREVLKRALKIPFNQIMANAGHGENLEEIVKTLVKKKGNTVYNVMAEKFEDGIKNGIIDPVLVTKTALINAASIAGTLLSTGCTISFEPNYGDNTLKV